jgi:DUF971 family protein
VDPVKEFEPVDIHVDNDEHVVITKWGDGHESRLPIERVRGWCPCAECQGHGGEVAWIDNEAGGITEAEPVGRYAIRFTFDDNHATGIYRWAHLRKLDPAEAERWGEPDEFMRQAS